MEFMCTIPVTEYLCVETLKFYYGKQVGFKMFLGVSATVSNWSADGSECSLILDDNPLVDFVELPDTCQGLFYCNILCGVIRGALEMVKSSTEIPFLFRFCLLMEGPLRVLILMIGMHCDIYHNVQSMLHDLVYSGMYSIFSLCQFCLQEASLN
jgi:hypothetical protein